VQTTLRWAEIRVETSTAAHEAVADIMTRNGCGGVAIKGDAPVLVISYLPVDDRLEERLEAIQEGIRDLRRFGIEPGTDELVVRYVEEDWAESWKEQFHTTRIGSKIIIKPSWEEYQAARGEIVLEIDPGMAFGTGSHPTTIMCLEILEKRLRRGMRVVDFGTGSGILAIAAAKLGASLVIALDSDEIAVRSARENVIRNEEEEHIEVHQTDNLKFILDKADLITANIIARTIIEHAADLSRILRRGGSLIASGITTDGLLEVEQGLRNERFEVAETYQKGDWVTLLARKAG